MSPLITSTPQNPSLNTSNSISHSNSNRSSSNNMMEERYYEAIIFSGPIVFTLIILFLLYFFYFRKHTVNWASLRMRQSRIDSATADSDARLVCEVGLKKEFRESLPIIIYKESFSVKDTLCSVCLGDYQAEDRLQQIPGCGHTFHLNCIDLWLTTHTTCPLCRRSLITSSKDPLTSEDPDTLSVTDSTLNIQNVDGLLLQSRPQVL